MSRGVVCYDGVAGAFDAIGSTVPIQTIPAVPSSGGISTIYDYEVTGSDKASIDTGVDNGGTTAAFPGTYRIIEFWLLLRTDEAVVLSTALITLNNDTGANYDLQEMFGHAAAASAGSALGQNQWTVNAPGASYTASYASYSQLQIPFYAATTFYKTGLHFQAVPSGTTVGNQSYVLADGLAYRSTSAITRLKVAAPGAQKLKIGSRLMVSVR